MTTYDHSVPLHDPDCSDNDIGKNFPEQNQVCEMPQVPMGIGATGTVFRLQFLGSVEVEEEGGKKRRKRLKKSMVEEAVIKIKVRIKVEKKEKKQSKEDQMRQSRVLTTLD